MADAYPDILVAAPEPPDLGERYCVVRDSLELTAALRRYRTQLNLAVVFSSFDLSTDHATDLQGQLPFIIIDSAEEGMRESAGLAKLLGTLSYFDRVVVEEDSRWALLRERYDLPGTAREPLTPGAPSDELLDTLVELEQPPQLPPERLTGTIWDAAEGSGEQRSRVLLRCLKQIHLVEQSRVLNCLRGLPGQRRLLEFGCEDGRWCAALEAHCHYTGVTFEAPAAEAMQARFPDLRFQSLESAPPKPLDADVILAVDVLNTGTAAHHDRLKAMLRLASDGTRLLMLEDFSTRSGGFSVARFEESLWEVSCGQLLLEHGELLSYPQQFGLRTRALFQTHWIGPSIA